MARTSCPRLLPLAVCALLAGAGAQNLESGLLSAREGELRQVSAEAARWRADAMEDEQAVAKEFLQAKLVPQVALSGGDSGTVEKLQACLETRDQAQMKTMKAQQAAAKLASKMGGVIRGTDKLNETLTGQTRTCQERSAQLKPQADGLREKHESLKSDHAALQHQQEELRVNMTHLAEEHEQMAKAHQALQKAHESLQTSDRAMTERHNESQSTLDDLAPKYQKVSAKLAECGGAVAKLNATIALTRQTGKEMSHAAEMMVRNETDIKWAAALKSAQAATRAQKAKSQADLGKSDELMTMAETVEATAHKNEGDLRECRASREKMQLETQDLQANCDPRVREANR